MPVVTAHLRQRPQHLADLEDLVHLAVAGKQGSEGVELCHDAAHGPDVDGRAVGAGLEQDLWRSVPGTTTRGHFVINFKHVGCRGS